MNAHPVSLMRNRSAFGHAEFAGQLLTWPSAQPAWHAVISSTARPMSSPTAAALHSAGSPAPTTVVVVGGVVDGGIVVAGAVVGAAVAGVVVELPPDGWPLGPIPSDAWV